MDRVDMFGRRILVLAAHPDDEVVACAASIGRALRQGAEVYVLYMTNGCIARENMWSWQRKRYEFFVNRRLSEAEKAAEFLDIIPLSRPSRPARHLWRDLRAVFAEIIDAISTHGIDQIWAPAYEGGNADHDALNAVAKAASMNLPVVAGGIRVDSENTPFVLEFAEYNFSGGKPRSQEFPSLNGTERTIVLTPEEKATKLKALAVYISEKSNLNYVRAEKESYRPLASYDYGKPPHPGVLWYERFQWVPFRHPRVDFTRPAEVSRAIVDFLDCAEKNFPAHNP